MIELAGIVVAGTLGAAAVVLAVHPKIERLWGWVSFGQ